MDDKVVLDILDGKTWHVTLYYKGDTHIRTFGNDRYKAKTFARYLSDLLEVSFEETPSEDHVVKLIKRGSHWQVNIDGSPLALRYAFDGHNEYLEGYIHGAVMGIRSCEQTVRFEEESR